MSGRQHTDGHARIADLKVRRRRIGAALGDAVGTTLRVAWRTSHNSLEWDKSDKIVWVRVHGMTREAENDEIRRRGPLATTRQSQD